MGIRTNLCYFFGEQKPHLREHNLSPNVFSNVEDQYNKHEIRAEGSGVLKYIVTDLIAEFMAELVVELPVELPVELVVDFIAELLAEFIAEIVAELVAGLVAELVAFK